MKNQEENKSERVIVISPYTGNALELPEGVTEAQYNRWLELYGKRLRIMDIPVDESDSEFITIVVIVPDRNVFSEFAKYVDNNIKKAFQIAITNCVKYNKEAVMEDDFTFTTCGTAIADLMPIGKAIVKN